MRRQKKRIKSYCHIEPNKLIVKMTLLELLLEPKNISFEWHVREKCFVVCLSIIVAINAGAKSQSFDFEDEKGINHVLVILDAPLEFISGKGEGVSGFVSYDPENPKETSGSIHLQVDSIELNNHLMTKNMSGKGEL